MSGSDATPHKPREMLETQMSPSETHFVRDEYNQVSSLIDVFFKMRPIEVKNARKVKLGPQETESPEKETNTFNLSEASSLPLTPLSESGSKRVLEDSFTPLHKRHDTDSRTSQSNELNRFEAG